MPFGYTGDATAVVVDQIERFAPGFRDRIIATVSKSTAELEAYNPNYIGGDIIGGANDGLQFLFRPGWQSIPIRRGCRASICVRSPRRRAPASTGCAATTPPHRRCGG